MKKMKKLSALLLVTAMTASMTVPAFAATGYTYIDDLEVQITYSIEAGSDEWDFDVSCSTTGVELDEDEDVKVTNAPDDGEEWGDDIKPKATIVLRAEDDYRFRSIDKAKVDLTISGLESDEFKYTVSDTSKKVTITVTLPELEYEEGYWDEQLEIDYVEWDDNGVARWAENEKADHYEFKLYRGSSAATGIVETEYTDADLSQYFTKKGDYTIKVRAVYGKEKGAWIDDEIYVDSEEAEDIRDNGGELETGNVGTTNNTSSTTNNAGGPGKEIKAGEWLKDSIGWWWCNADRTYPSSTWKLINNKWYYFNNAGYCVLNTWVQTNGIWYYCGPDGDMWVSRWTPDGYWVDANGVWVP